MYWNPITTCRFDCCSSQQLPMTHSRNSTKSSMVIKNRLTCLILSLERIVATRNFLWISAPQDYIQSLFHCFSFGIAADDEPRRCILLYAFLTHPCIRRHDRFNDRLCDSKASQPSPSLYSNKFSNKGLFWFFILRA